MDVFEIVRIVPEAERPKEKPIPPKPQSVNNGGTDEEWEDYWKKRDAYYHGVELRNRKG